MVVATVVAELVATKILKKNKQKHKRHKGFFPWPVVYHTKGGGLITRGGGYRRRPWPSSRRPLASYSMAAVEVVAVAHMAAAVQAPAVGQQFPPPQAAITPYVFIKKWLILAEGLSFLKKF